MDYFKRISYINLRPAMKTPANVSGFLSAGTDEKTPLNSDKINAPIKQFRLLDIKMSFRLLPLIERNTGW